LLLEDAGKAFQAERFIGEHADANWIIVSE
jgi:hypothetical protein